MRQKILDRSIPEPNSGCWLWTLTPSPKGYAYLSVGRGKVSAHRASYEAFVGPIPAGMEIDHKCRVRCCVNPAHLEPVVHSENIRRGKPTWQTHCKRGHPLSGDNVLPNGPAGRKCRACQLMLQREHYHTKGRVYKSGWVSPARQPASIADNA